MSATSPGEQGERITSFLTHQRTGVLCCAGRSSTDDPIDMWSMPVWYRLRSDVPGRRGLEVDCLVPRWADIAHPLTREASVVMIIQASSSAGLRWLQIQGLARPVEAPDWGRLLPRWAPAVQPDALYLVVRLTPKRIDLVDEDRGWGVQETLEW